MTDEQDDDWRAASLTWWQVFLLKHGEAGQRRGRGNGEGRRGNEEGKRGGGDGEGEIKRGEKRREERNKEEEGGE